MKERTKALLDRFPSMRRRIRRAYLGAMYLRHGTRGIRRRLSDGIRIQTPAQWIGQADPDGTRFFGYYDKCPWDASMRLFLLNRAEKDGSLSIETLERDTRRVRTVATTRAWNFQQGCMAQWLPDGRIIHNSVIGDRLGACIVSQSGEKQRVLDWPVQVVHPEGRHFLSLNYTRLDRLRPEYGYRLKVENFSPFQPLEEDGLCRVDIESGAARLLFSLADLAERIDASPGEDQKVNHAMFSPSGRHFVFMHRWMEDRKKYSRLYVARDDGSDLRLLLDHGMVSHYSWMDDERLIAFARTPDGQDRYCIVNIHDGYVCSPGEGSMSRFGDGHPTCSPDGRWFVTDSYPDRARMQRLLLWNIESEQLIEVGEFLSPLSFEDFVRCDLHPRWSPDGKLISVDSAFSGERRSYVLDVSAIVEGA